MANAFNGRSIFKYALILVLFFVFIELINFKFDRLKSKDYLYSLTSATLNGQMVDDDDDEYKLKSEDETDLKLFRAFLTEIREVSSVQKLVSIDYLLTTIKFMINEVDEYDPALIRFVRSIIQHPHDRSELNLRNKKQTDFSQYEQSSKIDRLLSRETNGFFIEAGGFEGESLSNTLFFELERAWTGLLIEPVPTFYRSIQSKKRHIYSINACIAEKRPFVAKFRVSGALSGVEAEMSALHLSRIKSESIQYNSTEEIAYIPCFSLNTIMRALNRTTVDYFSLDVEGAELSVLRSLDYKQLNIRSFSIEWAAKQSDKQPIIEHLKQNGYSLRLEDICDIYFTKN